jgi:hypothetical protein
MQKMLEQRKSTLKYMNAAFHSQFSPFEHDHLLWRGHLSSFVKFNALEELLVRVPDISLVDGLIHLLPESLTLLGLRDVPKGWDGVEILADAVKDGRFPQLKKVVLGFQDDFILEDMFGLDQEEFEEFEVARAQLDTAGVACERYHDPHPLKRFDPGQ